MASWPSPSTFPWEGKLFQLDLFSSAHNTRDPLTDLGLPALGPNRDQLPQDLNVTFFFEYQKATVETIEIINTTDGE